MGINLVIDEEKFGTDEFGRHTSNYTNLVFSTIKKDAADDFNELIVSTYNIKQKNIVNTITTFARI